MPKFKMTLALFTAYAAGEFVTTIMQYYKLNRALDNGTLIAREHHSRAVAAAYDYGWVDALAYDARRKKDQGFPNQPNTILNYDNA